MREEVKWFANQMEKTLKANDYKGGWQRCEFTYLFNRLTEEKRELRNLFYYRRFCCYLELKPGKSKEQAIKEATDVANFAMMIADIIRADIRK